MMGEHGKPKKARKMREPNPDRDGCAVPAILIGLAMICGFIVFRHELGQVLGNMLDHLLGKLGR